jgi:hypothetical protein
MRHAEPIVTWVVYERQIPGKRRMTLICSQPEWDALELTQPNDCVLIRAGITHEGDAEQLARSMALVVRLKHAVPMKPMRPTSIVGSVSCRARQGVAMRKWWEQSKRLAEDAAIPKRPTSASCVNGSRPRADRTTCGDQSL